jgi:hypothetical protein
MAWRVVGHHGGRPSPRRPLWNVRGREGADGREPRGKCESVVIGAWVYQPPLRLRFWVELTDLVPTDVCLAVAGASATIASDALMNPFDGAVILLFPSPCATAD